MEYWRRDGVVNVLIWGGFCQGRSPGDVWWKSVRGKGKSVCKGSEEFDILKHRAGQRRERMNLEANTETKNHRSVFTLCLLNIGLMCM